ncbi:hypothetical protein [Agreia sp. VKM Ac-1783]|uniref:hypothetical protein n=1 Tax=Agreia sp. VKM Ac-1783 TaxID=1938889 RepID=UPI000A2AB7D2|nr:hypothetical protein [Agreia sp. VKM Ac-1783]SMQ71968.1 hypothetical protein SAMN06295943_2848 [Agreia sp. VKM Ac-1783]
MTTEHADLPLPDYDHLPLGHIAARIAPLDVDQVQRLIDYETEHGDRLPVQLVLGQRLEALQNGATPSGRVHTDHPEVPAASTSSTVSPATTTAPAINPTSHGDPTNPS